MYDQLQIKSYSSLDDSNFVSNIQSIIVSSQPHVGFLQSVWCDQGIHFSHLDIIQLLDSKFDLRFARTNIGDENQGVVVFDLLHRTLSGEGMMNDGELIHTTHLGSGFSWVQTTPWQGEGLR